MKLCDSSYEPIAAMQPSASAQYGDLQRQVKQIMASSSFWERHGRDRMEVLVGYLTMGALGLLLLRSDSLPIFFSGILALSWCHQMLVARAAHLSSHNSFGLPYYGHLALVWFIESFMCFPYDVAMEAHAKLHHPHTNIIGLGDSSSWKVPQLGRELYMFIAPLMLPLASPLIGIKETLAVVGKDPSKWKSLIRFLTLAVVGAVFQYSVFRYVCNMSGICAALCVWFTRAPYYIPYIHINIFQHIGLCMYVNENRPDRITQISTGVLNLPRNPLLDFNFGHSLISCHIEHHLFPFLSDTMCLKIQPTVRKYFKEHGLAYNERTYVNRFRLFFNDYEKLMVNAPYITEFIGIR